MIHSYNPISKCVLSVPLVLSECSPLFFAFNGDWSWSHDVLVPPGQSWHPWTSSAQAFDGARHPPGFDKLYHLVSTQSCSDGPSIQTGFPPLNLLSRLLAPRSQSFTNLMTDRISTLPPGPPTNQLPRPPVTVRALSSFSRYYGWYSGWLRRPRQISRTHPR